MIHCSSCIWLLEHLHTLNRGIKHSFVNFTRKEVDVTFDESQITLRQVVELLSSIHYIPDLSHSLSEKKEDTHSYKKLLLKMGVAGFVFINVIFRFRVSSRVWSATVLGRVRSLKLMYSLARTVSIGVASSYS